MHITDDVPFYRNDDPLWGYLVEISLGELTLGADIQDELTHLLLLQITRNLGIPQEHLEINKQTLRGFIRQALGYITQGRFEPPVYLRFFCQRKASKSVSSVDCGNHLDALPEIEPGQVLRHIGTEISGAWGYFLIERNLSYPHDSGINVNKLVDLYLYREGE